jgi:hypothetical protein
MTPHEVLLRLFLSNPQMISLPDLAAGCLAALDYAGFAVVPKAATAAEKETVDAG